MFQIRNKNKSLFINLDRLFCLPKTHNYTIVLITKKTYHITGFQTVLLNNLKVSYNPSNTIVYLVFLLLLCENKTVIQ